MKMMINTSDLFEDCLQKETDGICNGFYIGKLHDVVIDCHFGYFRTNLNNASILLFCLFVSQIFCLWIRVHLPNKYNDK